MLYHCRYLQSVTAVRGIGERISSLLEKKKIETVEDLLLTLPKKYEDRRRVIPIADLRVGETAAINGLVKRVWDGRRRGRLRRRSARIQDDTGHIEITWFGWGGQGISVGDRLLLAGVIKEYRGEKQITNPDFQIVDEQQENMCIQPIYSETEGLRQRSWRRHINEALENFTAGWIGGVPDRLRRKHGLLTVEESLKRLHRPQDQPNPDDLLHPQKPPLRSLIFEELFIFQLGLALRQNHEKRQKGVSFDLKKAPVNAFHNQLPFRLTGGQQQCLDELLTDMQKPSPMHRLIHGDVGSGKTVLAMAAAYVAAKNRCQAAVMAPTEILAMQHAARFREVLEPLGIECVLLSGSVKKQNRRRLVESIAMGKAQVIVGTHVLFFSGVDFMNLGLVVVDEQHKFGVEQRASLIAKATTPDVLVMSATPIPRTMAMTMYGDLDISQLMEKPAGQGKVTTVVQKQSERENAYQLLLDKLRSGKQGFIVCPRLQEGEGNLRDVKTLASELAQGFLADYRLGVLHGKMEPLERQRIIDLFRQGDLDLLVATTVIEVGVDVPQAAVLLVENADRFGLVQLHQLRGRLARGKEDGLAVFLCDDECSEAAQERIKLLTDCEDGFAIAEADLELRGPGEAFGVRQHGLPSLRFAAAGMRDLELITCARNEARNLSHDDPELENPEHHWAKMVLTQRWGAHLGKGQKG